MDYYNALCEIKSKEVFDLFFDIEQILRNKIGENNYFTLKLLSDILNKNNKKFTQEDLNTVVNMFIANLEKVVRIDRWNEEPLYMVLDERHERHNYQRSYFDFRDSAPSNNKKFIVISDTHIGNEEVQNFELLHNVYQFALDTKINYIFHLGDIFQRVDNVPIDEQYAKTIENIKFFLKNYPKVDEKILKTIALLGNHDLTIYGTAGTSKFVDTTYQQIFDLRNLTKDNPAFLIYARQTYGLKLSNIPIHFSHKLYVDSFHSDEMINSVNDLTNIENRIIGKYPVYISGHLHKGLICMGSEDMNYNQLYIGVPSTSNINIESVVGYIINLDVESDLKYVHVSTLYSKKDNSIFVGQTYTYCVNKKNKILKKQFK